MNKAQGFSLTEVLVSLCVLTTTSLALLTQQWHVSQLYHQTQTRLFSVFKLDNEFERHHE